MAKGAGRPEGADFASQPLRGWMVLHHRNPQIHTCGYSRPCRGQRRKQDREGMSYSRNQNTTPERQGVAENHLMFSSHIIFRTRKMFRRCNDV